MIQLFFFYLGFVTVSYFFLYTVYHTIRNPKKSSVLFILGFVGFVLALFYSKFVFTFFWDLINIIQCIFLTFLTVHTIATLVSYKKRTAYIKSLPDLEDLPTVTVIVPTHNEEDVIGATIEKMLALNYDKSKLEVIVINDYSTDNTLDVIKSFGDRIKFIDRPASVQRGKALSMNELIPTLSSDLICVFDADSLPDSDFLMKGIRHFSDEKVMLVQGKNIEYNTHIIMTKLQAFDQDIIHNSVYFPKAFLKGMVMFEGRAAIFRKSTFMELDGFDIELPTEDWDYGCRLQVAGYKLVYDHTIRNYEQAPSTIKGYLRQRHRWLGSTVFSMLKNLGGVLNAKKLQTSQKVDYFFTLTYQMWSLVFNFFGFMGILNYFMGYNVNYTFTIVMFLLAILILTIPGIYVERKAKYVSYVLSMYMYYWSFTYVITNVCLDHFILKRKIKYHKTAHTVKQLNYLNLQNIS